MRIARPASLVATVALIGAFLMPSTTASAASDACSSSVIVLRDLHIEAAPERKKVAPGDKFDVKVTVTRPAHEDPLGQGIEFEPPASFPAEDVTVGLSIYVGERTYFWQVGITDANGEETMRLKVPHFSEEGWALAVASARHWIKSDCPDILEEGYSYYPRFVKVSR